MVKSIVTDGIEWSQCHDWTPWNTALQIRSTGGGYIIGYLFYVIFSVSMRTATHRASCSHFFFLEVICAVSAAALVATYASYARHSGIPEIKTVLGGFVMRRFMGGWTLLVKSLGLVSSHLEHLTPSSFCSPICKVLGCRFRALAREGRTLGSCGLLLCKSIHEVL